MKLIDKDALVAEIERRIKSLHQVNSPREQAVLYECEDIISFIDTLEVKDVDSRLTLEDISILRHIMFDYNRQVRNEMSIPNNEDYCKEVLKRFKAQNGEKI